MSLSFVCNGQTLYEEQDGTIEGQEISDSSILNYKGKPYTGKVNCYDERCDLFFKNGKVIERKFYYDYDKTMVMIVYTLKDRLQQLVVQKEYWENGNLEKEENYKKGVKHGPYRYYYENGQLKSEGNYKEGKKVGISRIYFESGEVKGEINYDN